MQILSEIIKKIVSLRSIYNCEIMMEKPPKIDEKALVSYIFNTADESIYPMVDRINEEYEYWDKVKYKRPLPKGVTPEILWSYVKASRQVGGIVVWPKYGVKLFVTNKMQRFCHEFDTNFGNFWDSDTPAAKADKMHYQTSSLIEEAIYSSIMEGASTTRRIAKDMLVHGITPKDKSQQMIFNNYQTIQHIVQHKDEPLTEEGLLYIHRLMTNKTMKHEADAGRFRGDDDNIVVQNELTGEIVYTPPVASDIPQFIHELCAFFNSPKKDPFIHPIIRGIIVHYMVAYVHPFVDGNGRTARALFYWYMMREGYQLTEYMSISRMIMESKTSYENAFRYCDNDGNDIGYFVAYNLRVLGRAYQKLKEYVNHKQQEKRAATLLMVKGKLTERQSMILQHFRNSPDDMLTVRDVEVNLSVTTMTARKDLSYLVREGYLEEVPINNIKRGYIRSERFDELINNR